MTITKSKSIDRRFLLKIKHAYVDCYKADSLDDLLDDSLVNQQWDRYLQDKLSALREWSRKTLTDGHFLIVFSNVKYMIEIQSTYE